MDIILASASPRRRQLLEMLGIRELYVVPADIDEDKFERLPALELVKTLSREKAMLVANKIREEHVVTGAEYVIIGADTVVALDGETLGKPRDEAHAAEMLKKLSGKRHRVYTGVTVISREQCISEAEETLVNFREISDQEIAEYIKTGEPMDKAGSYGAQGIGALFISGISGDFFNVMGLPLCRLSIILTKMGVSLL